MSGTRTSRALAALSVVACLGCCAMPSLLAAGVLAGGGWAVVAGWLPGVAVASLALAVVAGWWAHRRSGCSCAGACSC